MARCLVPAHLVANHKLRRPIKPPVAVMYLEQGVRTKLEKVAAILESEVTHNTLKFIQIVETDARRALSSNACCFVFRRRFHSDFHTLKGSVRSVPCCLPAGYFRFSTANVLGGLDGTF